MAMWWYTTLSNNPCYVHYVYYVYVHCTCMICAYIYIYIIIYVCIHTIYGTCIYKYAWSIKMLRGHGITVPKTSVIWIIQRMQGQHHAPQQNVPWHQWHRQNPEIWWSLMIKNAHWWSLMIIDSWSLTLLHIKQTHLTIPRFPQTNSSINITLMAPRWDPDGSVEPCWTYDIAPSWVKNMGHLWQAPPGF